MIGSLRRQIGDFGSSCSLGPFLVHEVTVLELGLSDGHLHFGIQFFLRPPPCTPPRPRSPFASARFNGRFKGSREETHRQFLASIRSPSYRLSMPSFLVSAISMTSPLFALPARFRHSSFCNTLRASHLLRFFSVPFNTPMVSMFFLNPSIGPESICHLLIPRNIRVQSGSFFDRKVSGSDFPSSM